MAIDYLKASLWCNWCNWWQIKIVDVVEMWYRLCVEDELYTFEQALAKIGEVL